MAKKVKSVQVGGTKKLVMDVVKTIFVVFMFLFYDAIYFGHYQFLEEKG